MPLLPTFVCISEANELIRKRQVECLIIIPVTYCYDRGDGIGFSYARYSPAAQ
ncbi:MAG: hypothetical protein K0Q79_1025 [Flavipsychrobacter sp.]|jgi:hypothetical protein|nr:hypothetical protein [Flavipsychrobacter sp.]